MVTMPSMLVHDGRCPMRVGESTVVMVTSSPLARRIRSATDTVAFGAGAAPPPPARTHAEIRTRRDNGTSTMLCSVCHAGPAARNPARRLWLPELAASALGAHVCASPSRSSPASSAFHQETSSKLPFVMMLVSYPVPPASTRSEEHTSELQSRGHLVCRLLLEKKNTSRTTRQNTSKNAICNKAKRNSTP